MLFWLNGIHNYGWAFVVVHVFPCYFQQDVNFQNNGFDLISLRSRGSHYFHGTWKALREWKASK